jgi:hypothetical protein
MVVGSGTVGWGGAVTVTLGLVNDVGGTMVLLDVGTGREVTVLVTLVGGVPAFLEALVGVGTLVGVGVAVTPDTRAGLDGVVVKVVLDGHAGSRWVEGGGAGWVRRSV